MNLRPSLRDTLDDGGGLEVRFSLPIRWNDVPDDGRDVEGEGDGLILVCGTSSHGYAGFKDEPSWISAGLKLEGCLFAS